MTSASARNIAAHLGVLLTYGNAIVPLRAPFWFTVRFNWDESTLHRRERLTAGRPSDLYSGVG
jgi:hypothetical protein